MDAQRNPNSLRRGPNSRTTETERQPFSDLSNFNLTPIETLRKLCCSTTTTTSATSSAGPDSSNFHCAAPKFPISVSRSDSKSSKPYNDNSTDAKSDTSIGSSTFIQVRNPSVFSISAPVRVPTPSHSSPTTSASGDGELAVYGKRMTTGKSNGEREATVLPCRSTLVENKRGKGDVIAEPVICLPSGSNKEREKVIGKPLNFLHPENKKDETEMADVNKDKGKGIVENVSLLPAKNKKDRGKENFESLSSPTPKNNKDRGNAVLSISSSHENKNKGKDIVEHVSHMSTDKKKDKGKVSFDSLSSPPPKTRKDRGNTIMKIGSSREKTVAKEIFDVSLKSSPSRKIRGKRKSEKFVFSCPPLPKTRNTRNKFNEAGDVELSGSWTDSNTKCTKKRHSRKQSFTEYSLPKDFVEQQRAYFKEIDEFELPEEEASD